MTSSTEARPLVSVVMPVRNGMPWLEHQLGALVAQQAAEEWEIVVADNGSDDGSQSCVAQWRARYPRMRVVDAAGASRRCGGAERRSEGGTGVPPGLL